MRRPAEGRQDPAEVRAAVVTGTATVAEHGLLPEPGHGPPPAANGSSAVARALRWEWADYAGRTAHRLPQVSRRVLRPLRRQLRSAAAVVSRRWHRSLQ